MVNNSKSSPMYHTTYATGYWLEGAGELVPGEKNSLKREVWNGQDTILEFRQNGWLLKR